MKPTAVGEIRSSQRKGEEPRLIQGVPEARSQRW